MALDVAYHKLLVLILRGRWRRPYLRFRRILTKMAARFFSSSWRILEPYSCATHPAERTGGQHSGVNVLVSHARTRPPAGTPARTSRSCRCDPSHVVEVRYDHIAATTTWKVNGSAHAPFNRWRPDSDPRPCTHAQPEHPLTFSLGDIVPGLGPADA